MVLDASAVLDLLLETEPQAELLADRLLSVETRVSAPHLIDIEVTSGLRRHEQTGALSRRRALLALEDFAALRVERYPHTRLLPRIWQLRDNLTPYDAAYVALAEALGAPLVTSDQALARSTGHRARIEVFPAA